MSDSIIDLFAELAEQIGEESYHKMLAEAPPDIAAALGSQSHMASYKAGFAAGLVYGKAFMEVAAKKVAERN